MSTRKNIDELYFSKFEGAEVTPPEEAWHNIVSRLPEKKGKRRIIPMWYRIAGVAAILLLGVGLGTKLFVTEEVHQMVNTSVSREEIHKEIRFSVSEFSETMLQVSVNLQEIMREREASAVKFSEEAEGSGLPHTGTADHSRIKENNEVSAVKAFQSNPPAKPDSPVNKKLFIVGNSEKISSVPVSPTQEKDEATDVKLSELVAEENAIAQQVAAEFAETKEKEEKSEGSKMSISTRVAPVFYDNMAPGNALGATMTAGEASGEVSFSYGINVAYQVSDRIKVRSGINKLDLSFSTPGVPMTTALNTDSFVKIDPSLMAEPVKGDLRQQMDYIEVPMEIEYRLMDSRIGVNLIAGGSTLFLNGNNASMDTGFRTTDLGQSDNMEKLNFSANIGVGLDYELTPKFLLSLEPMFKYQLKSYNVETAVRPYYMAIYSGFSFSF